MRNTEDRSIIKNTVNGTIFKTVNLTISFVYTIALRLATAESYFLWITQLLPSLLIGEESKISCLASQ